MRRAAAALVLGTLLAAFGAAAAEEYQKGWAYDLSHELMSPYGSVRHSIADCPSATHLVEEMVRLERAGRTRAEVEAMLYDRFGEVLRPAPRAQGFGLAAYVIPVLAAGAGAAVVVLFLRFHTRSRAPEPDTVPPAADRDPELERLVDEELRS